MSILKTDALKEQQSINEFERKIKLEKTRLDKKLTRQKILLGTFFIAALEKNDLEGLRDYVAKELPDYLNRATDKELFKGLVENLGGVMSSDDSTNERSNDEQPKAVNNNEHSNDEYSLTNQNQYN